MRSCFDFASATLSTNGADELYFSPFVLSITGVGGEVEGQGLTHHCRRSTI